MTKSAPGTARKLEWTRVSSRSRTRHFFPESSGCRAGRSLTLCSEVTSSYAIWALPTRLAYCDLPPRPRPAPPPALEAAPGAASSSG